VRELPFDVLREPGLRVLPGVRGGRQLQRDADLQQLRELPFDLLRQPQLPLLLPGVRRLGRQLQRRAQLRELRGLRGGERLQQHLLPGVHGGHVELHRYVARVQLLERLVLVPGPVPEHGVHLDRGHLHVLGHAVHVRHLRFDEPVQQRRLHLVDDVHGNAHAMRVDHRVIAVHLSVWLCLEPRDVHRHGHSLQRERDVDGLLGRVRLQLERGLHRDDHALQRQHVVDGVLRGERVQLVDEGLHGQCDELRFVRGLLRLLSGRLRRLRGGSADVHGNTDVCQLQHLSGRILRQPGVSWLLPGLRGLVGRRVRRQRHAVRREHLVDVL
jgi:hypothetical protein